MRVRRFRYDDNVQPFRRHGSGRDILAVGLFNSIMFPTLFTLGIEGLGPMTAKASSLLVMAIVGGAVIPLLQGLLADRTGVQPAFVLPLLCYAYIAWYALQGSPQTPASGRVRAA